MNLQNCGQRYALGLLTHTRNQNQQWGGGLRDLIPVTGGRRLGLGKHQILHWEAASSPAAADGKLEVQIAKLCADNNQLSWAQLQLIDIRLGGNKINLYIQSTKSYIN